MSNESAVAPPRTLKVFISYSHEDDALRIELIKHLSQLRREGLIENWHDRLITGGREWAGEIDDNLETADIVLLLVSASFLASDYCYDKEMTRALERDKSGEARVVPVILRPCDWRTAPFGKLQAFPKDAKPIITWQPMDDGYLEVAQGLRRVISEIRGAMAAGELHTPDTPPPSKGQPRVPASDVPQAPGAGEHWWLALKDRVVKIWRDPVWSKVIATAIVAVVVLLWSVLTHLYPTESTQSPATSRTVENKSAFETRKAALRDQMAEPEKYDSDKFRKELDLLLVQAPQDPDLIMLDGDLRYHSDGPEQARERYAKALELSPKLAEAQFRLGFVSDREGNLPDAQEHYRKAIEISPVPKYRNNYAHTYLESGLYQEAIAEYGKIEKYVLAGVEMGKARWALGQLAQARNEQARARDWIENPEIAGLPRNQEAWFFWVETSQGGTNTTWKEYRLLTLAEKRCYVGLSLSATLFLQGVDEEAKQAAGAAGCSKSSEHVKEVLAADLTRYVEAVQPRWVERSRLFRERYLNSGGQAAAGVSSDGMSGGR